MSSTLTNLFLSDDEKNYLNTFQGVLCNRKREQFWTEIRNALQVYQNVFKTQTVSSCDKDVKIHSTCSIYHFCRPDSLG